RSHVLLPSDGGILTSAGSKIFLLEVRMNAPAQAGLAALSLKDAKLFREQCYIDGPWLDADGRKSTPVHNPATGEVLGSVPRMAAPSSSGSRRRESAPTATSFRRTRPTSASSS